jgi:hypothetical protein
MRCCYELFCGIRFAHLMCHPREEILPIKEVYDVKLGSYVSSCCADSRCARTQRNCRYSHKHCLDIICGLPGFVRGEHDYRAKVTRYVVNVPARIHHNTNKKRRTNHGQSIDFMDSRNPYQYHSALVAVWRTELKMVRYYNLI